MADNTIPEILRRRAAEQPDALGYTFLADGETEAGHLTWGDLDRWASAVAAGLGTVCAPGDRALLLFPPGLDFIAAFFGCLYAGVVAVPAYPPRPGKDQGRLRSIAGDSRPRAVLTNAAIERRREALKVAVPELAGCVWRTLTPSAAPELAPRGASALAFLQYTSGSTSDPKGVEVTHENLIHNQRAIQKAFGQSEESVVVGWLPLYHDMGLIGNVLQPLFVGGRCVLMSPAAFLQRPSRWLRAIDRYRATTSGGPNFAYDLCVRRIGPAERAGLDLSSWQVAFNGAEPVRAETMDRFAAAFAGNGFRREAFFPCYGLAEATLLVSGGKAEAGQPGGSGLVAAGVEMAVADPATGERREAGEVGEIWVAGPGVARGYWGRPEQTRETFQAELSGEPGRRYLRTGDLGFLQRGELFVTGRIKDLILIRGRNLYPQDIERTAEESHPALRPGGGAAFAVEAEGEERLVVVHEVEPRARQDAGEAAAAVRRAVANEHQAPVWEVVLIPAGALPRTSSGKVRRGACREAFLGGTLPVLERHRIEPAEEDAGPSEPAETMVEELARRVALLLGVAPERVETDRPLGDLGLDSLASIELRAKLEEDFGIEVPLADLLEEPSLAALAAAIEEKTLPPRPPLPAVLTPARERGREEPASEGQRALWFLQQVAPGTSAQNLAVAAHVGNLGGGASTSGKAKGSSPLPQPSPSQGGGTLRFTGVDESEFGPIEQAFQSLSSRHEALRTTFPAREGEPVQRISEDGGIDFAAVEIPSNLSDVAWLEEEAHRPFDLAEGPLVRVRLGTRSGCDPLLLFAAHHIAVDFGSLGILLNELGQLLEGKELLPAEKQPADFSHWQAAMLAGPRGGRLWDFWRRRLEAPLPVTSLPADLPRRPAPVRPASQLRIDLPPEAVDRLRSQAREEGRTLYAELLAGLFALLARSTGETDLLIGSPASGRTAPGFAGTVGYLMNPLPMRAGISGDPAFADFAGEVWRGVVEALENQGLPSHLMAERLRPQLKVLFTFNRPRPGEEGVARLAIGEGPAFDLGGLELEPVSVHARETLFDLHLTLVDEGAGVPFEASPPSPLSLTGEGERKADDLAGIGEGCVPPLPSGRGGQGVRLRRGESARKQETFVRGTSPALAGTLVYAADLYDPPTIQRFANHLRNLLAAAAKNPCHRLSNLSVFGEAERWQLLAEWNDTGETSEEQPVHRRFFAQAEKTPEAAAVMSEWERLSYRDLAGRARNLAGRLRLLGIGPEDKVGLCAERTPDAIVGLLGILEAGAAYVPLDPAYPPERIAWILEDAGAGAVVSQRRLSGRLPEGGPRRVWLEDEEPLPLPLSQGARANLAYVLYTSGSTGRPKGVLVSHAALASYVTTAASSFGIGPGDRVLQFASLGFDTSAEEIFPCLASGGTLVLRTDAMVGSIPRFLEVCARWQVTVLDLPTAFWHELAAGVEGLAPPATLRLAVIGGERALPGAVEAWRKWAPDVRLVNTYGPTEATIVATACDLPDPGDREGREVAIGRPIRGVRAYVVDRHLQPVPPGSPGELALAGAGLARGYLGRPDLTAERFIPDPFAAAGGRLYRTGDRVRQRPDGTLEFAGRLDQQVKVRGYRVELGEVEAALAAHPSVQEAAVAAHRREGGDARLAAYVVPRGEAFDPPGLRRFLGERLPPYMIPGAFLALSALPRTAAGKLDRSALPLPGAAAEADLSEVAAPRTPAEAALAEIWADCLEVERVGIHDDFFALGGHSLLVTRVISRAREELGVEIPLHVFFEAPTVAELALTVESAGRSDLPPIRRVPRDGREIPLSFAQERLWFLAQLDPASLAYGVPRIVHVTGRFDSWALERAYEALLARHESLRTVFPAIEGQPVQKILPPPPFLLPRIDLRTLPEVRRRVELERLIATEVRYPFDLAQGPLLRADLVLLADESSTLIQTEHHIVHDGWTQGVLLDDLLALYTGFHEGRPASLPELPVQYADFAVWQREWLQGGVLAAHLAYWKGKLEGMPPVLDLPADRPRPPAQSFRGSTQWFALPGELLAGLSALARREGATLFMLLLAAFEVLLHRYARRDDLPVGSPIANRTHLEIEALIGFFVNTLLLRTDLAGGPSFRELLDRVRSTTLGAYAWQHLPFERLVEELDPERNLAYTPLCQVMFILQNARVPELRLPGLVLRHQEVHNGTAKFDLMMSLQERDGGLFGWVEYSTDLFDSATIERLRGHFGRLLGSIVRAPEKRLLDFDWLSESETLQIAEWGAGTAPASIVSFPSQAFALQAARTPDAVALVHRSETITYRELDRRVEERARHLRELAVGPEVKVAVCLEPGFDLVTALLAVLRAGGAYIPLDPSHPADRLKWILEDAGVSLVLKSFDLAEGGRRPLLRDSAGEGWGGVFIEDRRRPLPDPPPLRGRGSRGPALEEDHLAYVIYTSGSTGRPKGVEITRASLDHLLRSIRSRPGMSAPETVLSCTTVAFDVAGVELFLPLCTGGRIVLTDRDVATDGHRLLATLRRSGATLMQGTPATFSMLFEAGWEGDPKLRVWCAGEALPRALADRIAAGCAELWNLYGPTEATIYAAGCRITSGEAGPVSIGGPAGGASLQVLDPELRPVPAGVPGELFIGGPTVARGYLGRPDLTAARFVPDASGNRRYRTGDLVRWLPDGRIEFLGRLDHQVKLRGFRIELGEIEEALRLHPAVSQAAAVLAPGSSGDPRLLAYVVADLSEGEESPIDGWQRVWDEIYGDPQSSRDAAFDLSGWISSYTGEPIGAGPMREWVERTVERILGVHPAPPESVLEIGCGTGLLLYRIAPHCRRYCATDLSAAVVERLRRGIGADPSFGHVEVRAAAADDASVFAGETFDRVILNSVVQYFPSVEYLVKVLEGIAPRLRSGGAIFLGDLRSLPLLETFRTGVQLHRAADDLPAETLKRRILEQVAREKELVLDPRLFTALLGPLGIGHAEVQLKRGRHANELTRYRYDVVLRADPPAESPLWKEAEWREIRTLTTLRRRLEEALEEGQVLIVRGIPDARLAEEAEAWRQLSSPEPPPTVGELRRAVSAADWKGVEPEDLWELARELGAEAVVGWPEAVEVGKFEAVFRPVVASSAGTTVVNRRVPPPWEGEGWVRGEEPCALPVAPKSASERGEFLFLAPFANHPRAADPAERIGPVLEAFLRQHLPAYMVPSAFVVLDALPLTPTGKVDRKALPLPEAAREGAGAPYVPPRGRAEEELARIWSEVLGIERIGARDDFFALGGHSLIATRLVSRIQRRFGVEMPLRALFEAPTLAGLASRVEHELGLDAGPALPPLVAGPRPEPPQPIPLSFAQQRLWLLDRLGSGTAYNLPSGARLRGRLDPALLERCLNEVVRRHEVLRTAFPVDGAPRQEILPELHIPVSMVDLAALPRPLQEAERGRAASALAGASFELSHPPLLRAGLFRLAGDDHALVLALHHIVADGWSQGVLIRELTALYRRGGDPTALPLPPVQYADFAVWQRAWLSGEVLDAELGWWRERLAGASAALELPTDRPRPAVASFLGARHRFQWPARLARALAALGGRGEATLFMTLLAAFSALLGRYSGQEDVVVGSPIAHRNQVEIESLIGFFVNTLALRADLSGDPPFLELLSRVREATLGAYAHQDLPFERLVEELRPERSLGHSPLFQAVLALHNTPVESIETPGLSWKPLPVETGQSPFDLTLSLVEAPGGLDGTLTWRRDLFEEATLRRMVRHLEVLLAAAAARPDTRLSDLPVLSAAESHQLRHEWGGARASFPQALCLHERFEAWADRTPEAIALVYEERRWTYAELDAQANRLARYLRRQGVGPEGIVAIGLERLPEIVVAILAVWKVGGAYLPLDPSQPAARQELLLREARPAALLTASLLDAEAGRIEPEASGRLESPGVPGRLAYVLYTSGSTGLPKGCMVTHANVGRLLDAGAAGFGFGPEDVWTLFHAFTFDFSVWEMWGALAHGGRLVGVPYWVGRSPAAYLELLRREKVTVLNQTPSAFRGLLRAEQEAGGGLESVRQVFLGGEALPLPMLEPWLAKGREAVNLYGLTETAVVATARRITAADLRTPHRSPIGRPLHDLRIRVLGRRGEPAPTGAPGELHIGGPGVGRGYLGRPDWTAERFVPERRGERLYRTGDLVRFLPDGDLEYLGRIDHQVKVRGFRIELGEIEAALAGHPSVAGAAVLARDHGGEKRLVAYVVPRQEGDGDLATELRRALLDRLPEYMMPAVFVTLEDLPLSSSGKVDRRALPDPEPVRPPREIAVPRTPLEEALASLFADALELPRVGIHDSFFDLGGHSLLATTLIADIRDVLEADLPLRTLFTAPTVAALAAAVLEKPEWREPAERSAELLRALMDADSLS